MKPLLRLAWFVRGRKHRLTWSRVHVFAPVSAQALCGRPLPESLRQTEAGQGLSRRCMGLVTGGSVLLSGEQAVTSECVNCRRRLAKLDL